MGAGAACAESVILASSILQELVPLQRPFNLDEERRREREFNSQIREA